MPDSHPQMIEFSGERFTPECVREIRYEHLHRYALAAELAAGKRVLDAACGEGYGSRILSAAARHVTGVDISGEAIEHAQQRYQQPNLEFSRCNCLQLPFEDGKFDCVVSFETLEHLEQQEALLAEFRRVLHPSGFLLVSSPDRAIYSGVQNNENAFHVRELYRTELEALLAREFPAVRLMGQKLAFHSVIWILQPEIPRDIPAGSGGSGYCLHREQGDGIQRIPVPGGDAVYFVAACAAAEEYLPRLQNLWLFDDARESVYWHYHHEIRKNMQAGEILAARDREIDALKAAVERAQATTGSRSWWRRLIGG